MMMFHQAAATTTTSFFFFFCFFVLLLLPSWSSAVTADEEEDLPRLLQAKYRGRFEYLRGSTCDGPNPIISIRCKGNESELDIIDVSHSSIVCTMDTTNDNEAECTTTCDDVDCNDIWLETGTIATPGDGVYGNITFTCTSGENNNNIGAEFTYLNSGEGSCGYGYNTRNYHIAQLGILCSSSDDDDDDEDDDYSFSGNYFECTSGISFSSQVITSNIQPIGIYTCGSGGSCNNCDVQYDDIVISSEEHRLPSECITTLDDDDDDDDEIPPQVPTPSRNPSILPEGEYSVVFQALWSIAYRFPRVFCQYEDIRPVITMKCTNDNGLIRLVETTSDDTVECSQEDDSTIKCEEPTGYNFMSSLRSRNDYSGATFECTVNNELPEASVIMDEIDVECDGKTTPSLTPQVVARLRLGIACDDASSEFRYYDPFVECLDGNTFDSPLQNPPKQQHQNKEAGEGVNEKEVVYELYQRWLTIRI